MSAQRTVYIFVNGILTRPGDPDNWTRRAVSWIHEHTDHSAEAIEYFSGATISRQLFQRGRAQRLQRALDPLINARRRLVLVGHSNGCDVILDCLRSMRFPRIEALHLISAACEADCDRNGLNTATVRERIGAISIYIASRDWALRIGSTFTARFLFGYGTLGRTGPQFAKFPFQKITRDFGHGGWFTESEFDSTMSAIVKM